MLLCGLWHGASWTFVIWGGLHGLYLVAQRLFSILSFSSLIKGRLAESIVIQAQIMLCFSLTCFAWIFFRSNSFSDALFIINKLFQVSTYSFSQVPFKFQIIKGGILILFVIAVELISFKLNFHNFSRTRPVLSVSLLACITVLLFLFGTFANSTFIYMQF